MSLSIQDIHKIAHLARLSLEDQEAQNLTKEINQILEYVAQLNELNTEKVEPLSHTLEMATPLRADKVREALTNDEAMKNAPEHFKQYFQVPPVLGDAK